MQTETSDKLRNIWVILYSLLFIFMFTIFIQQTLILFESKGIVALSKLSSVGTFSLFITQEILFLIPVGFYLIKRKKGLKFLGLKKFSLLKGILNILGAFLVFASFSILLSILGQYYGIDIPGFGQQEEHLSLFSNDKYSFFLSFISLVLISPIVEEILFRGFFQTLLRKSYSSKTSIVISALIFSCIHFEFEVIIPLFILGCLLGYLYENNKSLWVPIIFHIINNGLAFLAELYIIS